MKGVKLTPQQLKEYTRVIMAVKRGKTEFTENDRIYFEIYSLRTNTELEVAKLIGELNV